MGDKAKIEWTDFTWNVITGCSVKSAGCKNCYAMKLAGTRLQHHPSRAGLTTETSARPVWNGEVRFNADWLDQPLRLKRPRKIFVCAHSDLFHESVPDEWIDRVFAVMALAPQHTFQVLTKRPERMLAYLSSRNGMGNADICRAINSIPHNMGDRNGALSMPLPNVWLGVSIENQAAADERIPLLLQTPAAVRWISAEPLLGHIDLTKIGGSRNELEISDDALTGRIGLRHGSKQGNSIDWVVVGGEYGSNARPMHPEWVRSLRDQCIGAVVPFLYKQHGEWLATTFCDDDMAMLPSKRTVYVGMNGIFHDGSEGVDLFGSEEETAWVGKKAAGRLLDGVQHDGYPK